MSINRREFCTMLGAWGLPMTALGNTAPWFPAFEDLGMGHDFEPLDVQGTLPEDLVGVLYRNGAMGMIAPDGKRYEHWFDGDGGILAVRLGAGQAEGAAKLLESPGLRKERRRGKRLHLGFGSTVEKPLFKLLGSKMKNVANTNVIGVGDELLALVESCPPTRIDPQTLQLLGPTDLGGVVKGGFSAHPHTTSASNRLINTGIEFGMKNTLRLYSVTPGGKAEVLYEQVDPHAPLVHDFGLTEQSAVLLLPPLRMDMGRTLRSGGAVSEGFVWEPERGTEVLIIPLDAPDAAIRFTVDPFFQWHVANAHQSGHEIVLDLVRYDNFENNRAIGNIITGLPNSGEIDGRLCRMRIDTKQRSHTMEVVGERTGEFPQTSPMRWGKAHRYVYLAEHSSAQVAMVGLPDRLTRYDMDTGVATELPSAEGVYPGEPLLVPKPGCSEEGDAWVLSMAYDSAAGRSGLLIYDAATPQSGPVASAWFSGPRHTTFHGHWQGA